MRGQSGLGRLTGRLTGLAIGSCAVFRSAKSVDATMWLNLHLTGTSHCGTAGSRKTDGIRGEVVGGRKQGKVGWVEGKVGRWWGSPTYHSHRL